jgi:two-component system cell cycle sensor histidine kinase/response regulator CckA
MKAILIVDDRAENRAVLIAMLGHRGYRLFEASGGEEALEIARKENPDLVIADVLMPKMDGFEFVRQLRQEAAIAHTPVVFYTASYIEEESRQLANACGVQHIIVKPAEPEEVFKVVDLALGQSPQSSPPVVAPEFEREHLHLVTDKLAEKVEELEKLNEKLEEEIAERKGADERLHEQAGIIDRARDAIIVRDFTSDRITMWNRGAEHLYGWSAAEAIGRPMRELIFAEANDRATLLEQLVSTGEFHGEIKHQAKDGREVIVEARVTLIRNEEGAPRLVLGINTDITERKKLETQLIRAQRLESIGTLASGVAHDLNNVLAPILMCSEMLRTDHAGGDSGRLLALIEESARRGAAIVKQVLTFARGVEGERVMINASHLVQEMTDVAQRTFPKAIQITGRYPENLWSIKGDPTQLHQVLLNLSVNARDAMPAGGTITIDAENFVVDEHYASMTPEAKTGPHVQLRVSDTGSGISRAVIDRMFDPFFTTKEIGKGTGLGLSTVLGIVKSHGGFISVQSEIGSGTIFKILLPADQSGEIVRPPAVSFEPLSGGGELLLIVDDEPGMLQITRMILEKHNYRVLWANDGLEALAIIAQEKDPIEMVLTDIAMPYMDGLALIRAIKKMRPGMTFIASTGQEETHSAQLQALGVPSFLAKPYDTPTLLTTVRDALRRPPSIPPAAAS